MVEPLLSSRAVTRLGLVLALAAGLLLAGGAAAAQAKRSVPPLFIGATFGGPMLLAPPDVAQAQFPKMSAAGVETIRTPFIWELAQPTKDGPIDLAFSDRTVALAAARRMEVMPHIIIAPAWNRLNGSDQRFAPPADASLLAPYVKALVARYGPNGSLWAENPQLPKLPIRNWQFWNEPELQYQWTVPSDVSWSRSYVDALRHFQRAVKEADPAAKVVLAGLTNASWLSLERLYRDDVKGLFDVAAIHPYTKRPSGVVELVRRFRAVLRRHGDGAKALFVTELGLPASRGRVKSKNSLQTTDRGMATFLEDSYAALAKARRDARTRVSRVYWYTWASEYEGDMFAFSGLFRYAGRGQPAARPAYRSFVRTARRLAGCRRTSAGVCR